MDDLISRREAIDGVKTLHEVAWKNWHEPTLSSNTVIDMIKDLPPAQPEPAIPLSWIEGQIKWLKSLDNAFSTLTAVQISAMVNKWKDEHDG